MKYRVTVEGRCFDIEIDHDHLVRVDGRSLYVDLEQVGGLPLYSLALDDEGFVVFVEEGLDEYRVEVRGEVHPVQVQRQRPQLSACPVECARDGECAGGSGGTGSRAGWTQGMPGRGAGGPPRRPVGPRPFSGEAATSLFGS
jgi:hypothetical protein